MRITFLQYYQLGKHFPKFLPFGLSVLHLYVLLGFLASAGAAGGALAIICRIRVNGSSRSIGSGKTVVELCSVAISASVCR